MAKKDFVARAKSFINFTNLVAAGQCGIENGRVVPKTRRQRWHSAFMIATVIITYLLYIYGYVRYLSSMMNPLTQIVDFCLVTTYTALSLGILIGASGSNFDNFKKIIDLILKIDEALVLSKHWKVMFVEKCLPYVEIFFLLGFTCAFALIDFFGFVYAIGFELAKYYIGRYVCLAVIVSYGCQCGFLMLSTADRYVVLNDNCSKLVEKYIDDAQLCSAGGKSRLVKCSVDFQAIEEETTNITRCYLKIYDLVESFNDTLGFLLGFLFMTMSLLGLVGYYYAGQIYSEIFYYPYSTLSFAVACFWTAAPVISIVLLVCCGQINEYVKGKCCSSIGEQIKRIESWAAFGGNRGFEQCVESLRFFLEITDTPIYFVAIYKLSVILAFKIFLLWLNYVIILMQLT